MSMTYPAEQIKSLRTPSALKDHIVTAVTQPKPTKPTLPRKPAPTLWERVWDCLGRGEFTSVQTDARGEFATYLKLGEQAYRVSLCDGRPAGCDCIDALRHSGDLGYACKHMISLLVEWGLARRCEEDLCGGVLVGRVIWHEATGGRRYGHFTCRWICVLCGQTEGTR